MSDYTAKSKYTQSDVAGEYDATRFKSFLGHLYDRLEKRAVSKALRHLPAPAHLLDLPVGTGRFAALLLDGGYEVTGADISEAMLEQTRAKLGRHERLHGLEKQDAEQLTYAEQSFDAVISIRLLGHIPPEARKRILSEMRRVSRGKLILAFYLITPFTPVRIFLRRLLTGKAGGWFPHLVTRSQLARELKEAGLVVQKQFSVATPLDPSRVLVLEKATPLKQ